MKDLIISAYTKFDFTFLKVWMLSLRETDFAGDVVVLALDGDEATNAALAAHGVKVVRVKNTLDKYNIVISRFLYIYDYLRNNPDYRYVLTTDMRDVVFQKNPSDYMERALGNGDKKLIAAGESLQLKYFHWNRNNFAKFYGAYLLNHVGDRDTLNAGVIGGTWEYMKDLCLQLFYMCQHTPDWGPDQAAFQLFCYHQPWKDVTHFPTLSDAWVLNSIVTNDPTALKRYGLPPFKMPPYMDNGVIKNIEGEAFAIVHLYDRVIEWTQYYIEKYQLPITKQAFPWTHSKLQAKSPTESLPRNYFS